MNKLKIMIVVLFSILLTNNVMAHDPKVMADVSEYKLSQYIKANEKHSIRVYEDQGSLKVGYGHKVSKKLYEVGNFVSLDKIDRWFKADFQSARNCARRYLKNDYNEKEFIIITDMAFQLGCDNLNEYKDIRNSINQHDYNLTKKSIIDSNYYNLENKRALKNIKFLNQ